ncbi:MAG: bifunctional 3-deoxy-7-phosphoheptulonate synthase/chorismate mutase type II [Bacteroidales bacterium]|nr:bifunctional 3-deoxy-7-phosphoheptulonate synthase/chorismate mutase type II [Bacteroidales bacterium]
MEFIGFNSWNEKLKNEQHLIIAGPCSAETKEQVLNTAVKIAQNTKVKVFRAGVWKPRTNPGNFEGVGVEALDWLIAVKNQTGLLTMVEVATPEHVRAALEKKVDFLWIGARTTVNPFSVQAIADELKGVDIPVLIKNPINPDLKLWIGAIQRIYKAGIKKIAAIHRGFFPFEETKFRNIPKWEIMIELKTTFPNLQIITDPSHIAGKFDLVPDVAEMALSMNVDGLMIETHINPKIALSDAAQQLTPFQLKELLDNLTFRQSKPENAKIIDDLQQLRHSIDSIDFQLLELLAKRMQIVEKIGFYKNLRKISVFQVERWKDIRETRIQAGGDLNLDADFVKKILQLVHNESINVQTKKNINK